ncbi:FAD-binding monooxygenase [Nocardia sp. SYP-A9097]|uniref:FAD-dependent monooxygenase n=1 Tax=Nocardia sp. SYP-A9097 TaxID=2663237 RepID=UPI00132A2C38|nr:FAD-dependent monooxygenase [Nocardia sp. SYP-A9097]MRH93550.1 FAD-binding monooxygenase [Nocardia sp. SYP-A9097]
MTETDVIIVGAGPTGLMLAAELRLAGVRPLVLERYSQRRETPKASGLGGQILDMLRYRGMLDRFRDASSDPDVPPRLPWGGVHLDFTLLAESPMHALPIPQATVEDLLEERAVELGAQIRRGHKVIALRQDADTVTAEVHGPEGRYQVTARYLVGCDGSRSPVRDMAAIAFPGTSYPEVNRFATVLLDESVRIFDNGDIDIPGIGRTAWGFTRNERGLFAFGPASPGEPISLFTTEDELTEYDNDEPMTLDEARASINRVLGVDLPIGSPTRLSRFTFQARLADRYRDGRILLAGDAAHQFPATGVALNAGMLDTVNLAWKLAADIKGWAPDGLVESYHTERRLAGERTLLHTQAQVAIRRGQDAAADALRTVFQELLTDEQPLNRMAAFISGSDIRYPMTGEHALNGTFTPDLTLHTDQGITSVAALMHTARPLLLDLADRPELREVAREWAHRIEIHTGKTDNRPADTILIRPDARIAWAAGIDEPTATAVSTLREALTTWFGAPLESTAPVTDPIM